MRILVSARTAIIASAGILTGVMLSGVAHAIVENTFRYSEPRVGRLMVPAAAFTPSSGGITWANNGGTLGGSGCFLAPVNLPQGATITHLTMWYSKSDNDPESMTLLRLSPGQVGGIATIGQVLPANTSGAIRTASVDITSDAVRIVNNGSYAYYVEECQSVNETFINARVTYTYTTAGD